jgi:hypothetical protein
MVQNLIGRNMIIKESGDIIFGLFEKDLKFCHGEMKREMKVIIKVPHIT